MDDEGVGIGMFFGAIMVIFVAIFASLLFDVANAGPNGQCAAIGGEYVSDIGSCVIDEKVVPLPVE